MKALDFFVDRPLPVFLAAGLISIAGAWCLFELPVKQSPSVQIPFSIVIVPYSGAAPDDVEADITIDLDEQLNALDGLRHLTSVSSEGLSTHILEFEDRADLAESLRDVQDKADLAAASFPDDADAPLVKEMSFDDLPIVFFTLTGAADLYRLRELANEIKPQLESVPGASRVEIFGGFEREVRISADPALLSSYGLTLESLADKIQRQSRGSPSGQLRSAETDRRLRATGEFRGLDEIRSITIASEAGGPIALRDIATVQLSHERLTSEAWLNSEPSVTLIVHPRPKVNTMETVRLLNERIEEIRSSLPEGVRIQATSDASEDISQMLRQLGTSAVFGVILVVGILLLMFGPRQAVLIGSVLPFSLLFTFLGLYIFDMEISNVALFALILVLGLVVDGAIIVGEAIQTEWEAGTSPRAAAKAGLARVGLPVLAADLTTIAAFAPMLAMVGVMGQFMSVMPKVVIFALIGSVFVDHLLLPAAAGKLGRHRAAKAMRRAPDGLPWFSPQLPRIRRFYLWTLDLALARRATVVVCAAASLAGAALLFGSGAIDSIFLPTTDRGRFTLNFSLPVGTDLIETGRVGRLLGREVAAIPEVQRYVLVTGETGALNSDFRDGGRSGPEHGRITVELTKLGDRTRSQDDVIASLRERSSHYAGVEIDIEARSEGPPVGAALALRITGKDLDEIAQTAEVVRQRIAGLAGARDVRTDYDRSKPQIRVELDRAHAAEFGITPERVSQAMLAAFTGLKVGRMWIGDERADIRLQAPEHWAQNVDHISELPVSASGQASSGRQPDVVLLGEVATVEFAFTQNAIFRHNGLRTVTVRADAAEGTSSVALEQDARKLLAELSLPAGVAIEFSGESEERNRSYASLLSALKFGALLIYVIVAIQFNSLRQPLIVLLSIPLSIVGVTAGLIITGTPFSFMVLIGMVALTGIVVNDGIVMIDAINRNRRAGMATPDAIRDAARRRLRPVLLTTITTVAGLLPLTLNLTEGGEFWTALGTTIISGLLVASALTLIVIPVLYSLLEDQWPESATKRRRREWSRDKVDEVRSHPGIFHGDPVPS